MPNNKKNRKNKEKKAARAAATVGPTAAEQSLFICRHNPASCNKCMLAYPPGCLHSLRQDERMSPEMNEIIPIFHRLYEMYNIQGWLEHASFATERMVRFFFYQCVKSIVNKDSLFGDIGDRESVDYKKQANFLFCGMLMMYRMLKCGSGAAARQANASDVDLFSLDEAQLSIRALCRPWYLESDRPRYNDLVYMLNELSPCNCLEAEVKRAKETERMRCSNVDCDQIEESENDLFSCCAGCNIAHYCSRRCYKDHWRGHTTSTEPPHKIACEAQQELKSVLAGGIILGATFGGDDGSMSL